MNGDWLGLLLGVVCGSVALGCGGSSKHPDGDDAGTGGMSASGGSGRSDQGGSGASAQGGSGGSNRGGTGSTSPPPAPAAVGLSISLSPPQQSAIDADIGSRTCTAGASGAATYTLGKPVPNGTLADGTDGVSVDCTVRADGSFNASVSGYDSVTKASLSLNVSGAIDESSGGMSSAVLQFYSPQTLALHTGSPFPDCTIGAVTTLKEGAVLADFSCPIIIASDDSTTGCAVHGTLALEYCKTGREEP